MCPTAHRVEAWKRLARDLDLKKLNEITTEIPFDTVISWGPKILAGEVRGRIVVKIP
jgi:acrylyl-CoA reductase (NADPH)